ncbi:neo-calmodulin [Eurytemora carolleeae]|uniref:neo-calmodulin n=1 Tax=Eurytemora carolleeae TaxID=1294199 RepID=UPI000C77039E|nr:neo-calmodulin [Eurytemora carolleeae]XP_023321691.1 neo-calmodulin [Eurytemora carolleeae]|eukprot:XP_023321690.1 neo-calmodulin-like [Eurytemora affinis]
MDELMNAEFKEAFDEFDKDGSGSISTKELLGVMRSMGQNPTEDEVLELVMEVDLNGDGTIDFQEFLQMMKKKSSEEDQMEDLREAFRMFDRNKDGFIDLVELRKVTSIMGATLSTTEIQEFMKEADKDGNGKIDYDEFVNMMKQY